MSWCTLLLALLIGGLIFAAYTDNLRFLATLYLITRVSPYEQVGTSDTRLLVLGDSTGYGTGAKRTKDSIAGRIGANFPYVTIHNDSKNGRRFDDLAASLNAPTEPYTVVLLQMGGNDILAERPVADVLKDLETIYNFWSAHSEVVVLMTAGNVGGAAAFQGTLKAARYEALSRSYYEAFHNFAASRDNFVFVDLFDEPKQDVFVLEPKTYIAADGLHPSTAGYGRWYEDLQPVLEPYLTRE